MINQSYMPRGARPPQNRAYIPAGMFPACTASTHRHGSARLRGSQRPPAIRCATQHHHLDVNVRLAPESALTPADPSATVTMRSPLVGTLSARSRTTIQYREDMADGCYR